MALDAGARIIGGCCGTTPEHIGVMRRALEAHTPGPPPDMDTIVARLGQISGGARKQLGGEPGGEAGGGRRGRRSR
jgi:5-methyltetrahydrofolate--homocysteine methyltransferase